MNKEPETAVELLYWILAPHIPIGSNAEFVRRIKDYAKEIIGDNVEPVHQGDDASVRS